MAVLQTSIRGRQKKIFAALLPALALAADCRYDVIGIVAPGEK